MVIQTNSTRETVRIGRNVGIRLRPGDVVALVGGLGTGKTHFIKGLAAGAGVKKSAYISSPSFTLINEYPGRIPFYHIDLYRLETGKEAEELGLEEYFRGQGITAIEWADRIPSALPKEILWVRLSYVAEHIRSIEIHGEGKRYKELIKDLSGAEILNPERLRKS